MSESLKLLYDGLSIVILSKLTLFLLLVLKEKGKKQIIGINRKKSIKNDKIRKIMNNATKIRFKTIFRFIVI